MLQIQTSTQKYRLHPRGKFTYSLSGGGYENMGVFMPFAPIVGQPMRLEILPATPGGKKFLITAPVQMMKLKAGS
jgi:hypothetical protein